MHESERLGIRLICLLNGDCLPLPDMEMIERDEQRIAIAVCDATGMTPERWDGLDPPSREPWLIKTLCIVREKAKQAEPTESHAKIEQIQNEAKVEPEKVPSEYREGKKLSGEILTVPYLLQSPEWPFKDRAQLSKAHRDGKLTKRIKVGRPYVYLYDELAALWRDDSLKG